MSSIVNNTAETGDIISAGSSDISVSDQLDTTTDPDNPMCTLYRGNINEIDVKVITTTTTEARILVDTTTAIDIPGTTSRSTPDHEMTTITMKPIASQPTKPSVTTSVYFELNGKVYPKNMQCHPSV